MNHQQLHQMSFLYFCPALPPEYMASLREQPGIVEQMIDYHTVLGSFTTDKLRGNQLLDTELKPTKLKVSVFINVSIDQQGTI